MLLALKMDLFEKYYNYSLRFLSYRPRSEKEIRDYLKKKKVSQDIIQQIIAKLKEHKFLNDEEFTKWWVESRTRFKPRSLRLIKMELKQKGISSDIIDAQVSNDFEQAKKLAEKKIARYKGLSKNQLYQKLGGLLSRRGFNYETVKKVIDEVAGNGV